SRRSAAGRRRFPLELLPGQGFRPLPPRAVCGSGPPGPASRSVGELLRGSPVAVAACAALDRRAGRHGGGPIRIGPVVRTLRPPGVEPSAGGTGVSATTRCDARDQPVQLAGAGTAA